tara:strand:- start:208 stop:930 length:723 start_codon:yes stop_codon:yes gene_type:complete
MEVLFSVEGLISLLTLSLLEIVLGIDNIIFISILTNKLPEQARPKARFLGISLALIFRVVMLLGITWIIEFTEPLFTLFSQEVTGRDLVLMAGGLFLLAKSTSEIHEKMDPHKSKGDKNGNAVQKGLLSIIIQIGILDIVFSFDSILTAIGMTDELIIMITAVIISLVVMLIFSSRIANFIEKHPSLQVLALSFLILIGFVLIADGLHVHIPKGYIYVAVAFSLLVEVINIRSRSNSKLN